MQIDRKKFLLVAAGLSQSLGCVAQSPPVAAGPHHNPYGPVQPAPAPVQPAPVATQPGPRVPGTVTPRDECVAWSPRGECSQWESQVAEPAGEAWQPVAEGAVPCTEWSPQNECIAWGQALANDTCAQWDPTGECIRWNAQPAVPAVDSPRNECVAWNPNGSCSIRESLTPADECGAWGANNECTSWLIYVDI